jgi:hypothetical protein
VKPRPFILSFGLLALNSCSLVRTTAGVTASAVTTAAQVTSTGVKVAGTAVSSTAAVGSAAVAAGAATRAAAAATAHIAILGATTLMHGMQVAREEARREELEHHPVTSLGQEPFQHADGRVLTAPGCLIPEGTPALLVQRRDGRLGLRTARPIQAASSHGEVDTLRCTVTKQAAGLRGH